MTKDEYINEIKNKLTTKDWAKIKTAKQRKDCAHLYEKSAVDGIDYQECPITGRRMASITGRYIKTLPTTEEEYFKYFPELKEVPEGRKEVDRKAKQKLYLDENGKHILNEDGKPMTVGEVNIMRKMETMKQVGEDGLTGNQRAGQKSRESHLKNVNEYGMNGYQQQKLLEFLNGNGIKAKVRLTAYDNYAELIRYITFKSNFNDAILNGQTVTFNGNMQNIEEDLQVDHIYSRRDGYDHGQSPFLIGHPENTNIITIIDNINKNDRSDITLAELYQNTGYTKERSEYEYELFIEAINKSYELGGGFSNLFVFMYMVDNYKLSRYYNDFKKYVIEICTSNGTRYKK